VEEADYEILKDTVENDWISCSKEFIKFLQAEYNECKQEDGSFKIKGLTYKEKVIE